MKYGISLGNSHIGRLAIETLVEKGIAPGDIVAVVRSPEKAKDLAEQGIEIRIGEYGDTEGFTAALDGVDALYMVSGMATPDDRIRQHRSVIDATKSAGVGYVVYVSFVDTTEGSPFFAWTINQDSEAYLRNSGIEYTILRSGMYSEADLDYIPEYLEAGKVANNIGDGKISYISRREIVLAAVHCLLGGEHKGQTYTLTGPEQVTQSELAALISKWTGREIPYEVVSDEFYRETFPEPYWADVVVTLYQAVRQGNMEIVTGDFEKILGRRAYTLQETYDKFYDGK
jgi:NAD(P)H dehydrogenase (quinone)